MVLIFKIVLNLAIILRTLFFECKLVLRRRYLLEQCKKWYRSTNKKRSERKLKSKQEKEVLEVQRQDTSTKRARQPRMSKKDQESEYDMDTKRVLFDFMRS